MALFRMALFIILRRALFIIMNNTNDKDTFKYIYNKNLDNYYGPFQNGPFQNGPF